MDYMREKSSKLEQDVSSYIGKKIVLVIKHGSGIVATGKNYRKAIKNAKAKGYGWGDVVLQYMRHVIDEEKVFGPYKGRGGYLAILKDYSQVVGWGEEPLAALEDAKQKGYEKGVMCMMNDQQWGRLVLALA